MANYGHWKLPENDAFCGGPKAADAPGPEKVRIYCSPKSVTPARHALYRNNGDLTFTDVTEKAGLGRTDGRGLGVVAADLNDDGRIDLYVANDMCANFVVLNRGDGSFDDVTPSSGAGFGPQGQSRAGMGVDAEDVDGDGRTDIFVTNYWAEGSALFVNLGNGLSEDRSRTAGLYHDTISWVGWGCSAGRFRQRWLARLLRHHRPRRRQPASHEPVLPPVRPAALASSQPRRQGIRAGDPGRGGILRLRSRRQRRGPGRSRQ